MALSKVDVSPRVIHVFVSQLLRSMDFEQTINCSTPAVAALFQVHERPKLTGRPEDTHVEIVWWTSLSLAASC